MNHDLESTAATLVADGKGILAADESVATLTRRFDSFGIQFTEQSRRAYCEMLFTTPGAAEFIPVRRNHPSEELRRNAARRCSREPGHHSRHQG
jgi:Fructose-bisphosphate aldolase class-I